MESRRKSRATGLPRPVIQRSRSTFPNSFQDEGACLLASPISSSTRVSSNRVKEKAPVASKEIGARLRIRATDQLSGLHRRSARAPFVGGFASVDTGSDLSGAVRHWRRPQTIRSGLLPPGGTDPTTPRRYPQRQRSEIGRGFRPQPQRSSLTRLTVVNPSCQIHVSWLKPFTSGWFRWPTCNATRAPKIATARVRLGIAQTSSH